MLYSYVVSEPEVFELSPLYQCGSYKTIKVGFVFDYNA